jgi:hypothetical protein
MEDYQKRVVEEKEELDGRITKLGDFLMTEESQKIAFDEHERMTTQMKLMIDAGNSGD